MSKEERHAVDLWQTSLFLLLIHNLHEENISQQQGGGSVKRDDPLN